MVSSCALSKLQAQKSPPQTGRAFQRHYETQPRERTSQYRAYFGGAGANPSRLRPGSGLGLGFGAFLTSFLPLSLLPMPRSVTQKGVSGKDKKDGKTLIEHLAAISGTPRQTLNAL